MGSYPVGVILGVAATVLFVQLLDRFVVSVIFPYLHSIFAVERPGGVTSFSGGNAALYDILSLLSLLSTFPLGMFLGGLVGGVVVRSSPGLHGALSGAAVATVGLAWSSAVGLCVLSPVAVLMGFLGGGLGGHFWSGAAPRSAAGASFERLTTLYAPDCVEGRFCELRAQDPAWFGLLGYLRSSPRPIRFRRSPQHLVEPDKVAGIWFLYGAIRRSPKFVPGTMSKAHAPSVR